MALVVMCGQPSSGKSTAAIALSAALNSLERPKPTVRIIDDSSLLHLSRNQTYQDMTIEENLRCVLRSEVNRSVSKDIIIIVDSLNNVKGYRYELWCLARVAGIRYCVVFCDTDENTCEEWNIRRLERGDLSSDNKMFADLVRRFEIPDRRNCWDSPLFELVPYRNGVDLTSSVIAEVVSYLTQEVDSKIRGIKVLQPTIATQNKWPGLPRGVKFDPSDEELLWHLLAEIGDGEAEPHPYICEFINFLDEDNEFDYSFPHKLPGVKQDGSFSYFFHRAFKVHDNKRRKRRKTVNDELGTICWHRIGKTKPIYIDGIHKGSKKMMVLYMSMADGEKPEKTSWIMHQYHVGVGEDAVGNLIISKIFYQQKLRQGDNNTHNFCLDTAEAVSMEGEFAVPLKLVAPETHAWDSNLISMDVPTQVTATCHEMQAEENNADSELRKLHKNTNLPTEDSKNMISPSQFLLNSQLQRNDIRSYAGFVQQDPSCGHEEVLGKSCISDNAQLGDHDPNCFSEFRAIPMDKYDTEDASSSGKNDCDTANEETLPNMLDAQACIENLCLIPAANGTREISSPTVVDFLTINMLDHATHVKAEPSDYMLEVSCNDMVDNISPAATRMSELSHEPESDEMDYVSLQERYRLMLPTKHHVLGCHYKLEYGKDNEPCDKGFASYNRKHGKDSGVLHMKERQEASVGYLETSYENISAPQECSFRSNINSIGECFSGKVKNEIQPADEQISFRICELKTAQHVDTISMAHRLMKSLDHVVSGSHLASLPSPSCLNNLSLEPRRSDESQDSGNVLLSQASDPEARLPIISCEQGHVNGKSHSDSSITFAVQLKSEPVEENLVSDICETNSAVQCSTDILCYPVTDIDTCSLPAPCHREDTKIDDSSFERCKSQHFLEGGCRHSDESLLDSVRGLLRENDSNHPSDTIPHVLPLEVKAEPLEESSFKCILENNAEEPSSPFPKANLYSHKKIPISVPSSCSIRPKLESVDSCQLVPSEGPPSILPEIDIQKPFVKMEYIDELTTDFLDHIPLRERMQMLPSISVANLSRDRNVNNAQKTLPPMDSGSSNVFNAKTKPFSLRRKRKKTATDSVETALEEDAPGLLQVLLDKGITIEEIKLYGDAEDEDALPICSSDDSFDELEAVMSKIFPEGPSIFKFLSVRQMKGSKAVYCLACLISLIEQTRYLRFRKSPVEWGWCRDLQSFIFIFERHNRIVVERPEYGYATYFFELVESLPIGWQIKRLVTAMKLPCCSRTVLIENKPLLVGEDLTEGEARVMEEYGWTRNSGLGTMLNYCDRVVHDRKDERYSSEWSGKIGKLLMKGMDGGRTVLDKLPKKATQFVECLDPVVKLGN